VIGEPLPAWEELAERDRAIAVYWMRTVEGEGFHYAIENYATRFRGDNSEATLRAITREYQDAYSALSDTEFMSLYDHGEELR
jgi:hypothetical protein